MNEEDLKPDDNRINTNRRNDRFPEDKAAQRKKVK